MALATQARPPETITLNDVFEAERGLVGLILAEEIEDLGNAIYNRLESALRITLMHLLKWDHQPSLKVRIEGAIREAYERARIDAAGETGLDEAAFPAECPYAYETIMTRAIVWPPEQ